MSALTMPLSCSHLSSLIWINFSSQMGLHSRLPHTQSTTRSADDTLLLALTILPRYFKNANERNSRTPR